MNDSRTVTFPVADTTRIVRCFVRPDGKNDTEDLWNPAMEIEAEADVDPAVVEFEDPIPEATEPSPSESENSAETSGSETASDSGSPISSDYAGPD